MSQTKIPEADRSSTKKPRLDKSHDILTCTIKTPEFSYAHMELITDSTTAGPPSLDELQVKSYCTAALRQFLGLTGAGMSLDILKAEGAHCWVRVPRPDLGSFAAAITAWRGTTEDGVACLLRVRRCSDWLGSMVGSEGQDRLWNSS
jgi:ribonuclease P/MRP protein subunit POP8